MTEIHYFQRYSSFENAVTNNTLQLFSRIYEYSPQKFSEFLSEVTNEDIQIGTSFQQQRPEGGSVPDAAIFQDSFKILIETKVGSAVNLPQLLRHASSFQNESVKILLLLAPMPPDSGEQLQVQNEIQDRYPGVIFCSVAFEGICAVLSNLFDRFDGHIHSIAADFISYCHESNLIDQSRYLMRVVPCGQSYELNVKHGVYFHHSARGYSPHSFLGLYSNKSVRNIWEIDVAYDVSWDGVELEKILVTGQETDRYDKAIKEIIEEANRDCGYDVANNHRFFCGNPVETNFVKISPGGIQGTRIFNLQDLLGEISSVEDIALRLSGRQWT